MKMRQFTSKYRCLSPKNTTDPDSKILIQTPMIQIQKVFLILKHLIHLHVKPGFYRMT